MSKPEWGAKRICPSCNNRYYDMRKNPPICPSCKTPFDAEVLVKKRRKEAPAPEKKKAVAPIEDADDLDDIVPIGDDDEESLIEDAAELGDEDSDLDDVVDLEDSDNDN